MRPTRAPRRGCRWSSSAVSPYPSPHGRTGLAPGSSRRQRRHGPPQPRRELDSLGGYRASYVEHSHDGPRSGAWSTDEMDRTSFDRLFDMTDRTVIVTGGTRGIGLALAEGFVLAGARVVVASRKADACEEAAKHLRGLGGQAVGVAAHTGSLEDLDALVDRTVAEFGGIDVVVNNAANALAQPLGELTPEAMTKSYEVNQRGPVFLVQKALPHLKASSSAAVLNVVSVGAFNFSADMSLYVSTKAA